MARSCRDRLKDTLQLASLTVLLNRYISQQDQQQIALTEAWRSLSVCGATISTSGSRKPNSTFDPSPGSDPHYQPGQICIRIHINGLFETTSYSSPAPAMLSTCLAHQGRALPENEGAAKPGLLRDYFPAHVYTSLRVRSQHLGPCHL